MRLYRPGQFAKLIGVSTTTLRNWDKQGVLIPVLKTPNGERRYSEEQLQQILQNKSKYRVVTANFVSSIFNEAKEHGKSTTTNKDVSSQCTKTTKTDLDAKEYNKATVTDKSDGISLVCRRTEHDYEFQNKPDISQSRINVGYARVSTKEQENELKRQIDLLELYLVKQGRPFKIISDIGSGIDYSKQGLNEMIKLTSSNQVDTIYVLYKDRLVRFGFKLIEEFAKHHNTKIEVINQTEDKIDEEEFVEDVVNVIQLFSYIFNCKSNGIKGDIINKVAQRLLEEKEKQ